MSHLRVLAPLLVVLSAAGCGSSGPTDAGLDASLDGGADGGPGDAPDDRCIHASVGAFSLALADDVEVRYRARITPELDGEPWDLYLTFPRYATEYVGTFPLGTGDDGNFGTCAHCVIALFGTGIARGYFADRGTLTLTEDPFALHLAATLENLRLVEVTIEGDDLHSVPVPGGDCIVFDRIEEDRRFPPPGWTCAADRFRDGTTCDCRCGVPDDDCFDPALPVADCRAGQVCVPRLPPSGIFMPITVCADTCDRAGDVACPGSGVCVDDPAGGVCEPEVARIDRTTPLGGTCAEGAYVCAVDARGFARGVCDVFDWNDRTCRPRCDASEDGTSADCDAAAFERCFTLGSRSEDPTAFFGLCTPRYPASWSCSGARFEDGAGCDCACGAPDPDCSAGLPLRGCAAGEVCLFDATCASVPTNDTCAGASPLAVGRTTGTTRGATNDYSHVRGAGGCIDVEEDAPDVVYSVVLSAGQRLTVTGVAEHDIALYLLGPGSAAVCDAASTACVAGAEATGGGEAETLTYTAAEAGTYYLVVDAFFSELIGAFQLDTAIE